MATEPTDSTDPLTTFLGPPPPQEHLIDAGVLRMNIGKRSGRKGEQQECGLWVGYSVGSVDSVANLGWGGGARIIRRSFTRNSQKNPILSVQPAFIRGSPNAVVTSNAG